MNKKELTNRIKIIWKGIYYQSIENCVITISESDIDIKSQIIGHHQDFIYNIEYYIKTNKQWETQYFIIDSEINHLKTKIEAEKVNDNWIINGEQKNELKLCTDIDISLTPFTNTLPINRLKFNIEQKNKIDVLYINILEQKIIPVQQNYTKLSEFEYKYENISNDFEAIIKVDETGLVINYPELFERTDKMTNANIV